MSALFSARLFFLLALALAFSPARAEPVRLVLLGDIMLDDGPGQLIAANGNPFAPFASLLADADYRIGNLECSIATSGKAIDEKIYTFRAHPRVLPVLKSHVDAVAVANNHSGDFGKEAFLETLTRLQENGIAPIGGGRNLTEAHAPHWVEIKGLRIALLAYNEFKPRSFEAGPETPGIAWSEDAQVIGDLRAARQAGADLVIPLMHWGWERETAAGERQRRLARTMIDAGADLVVGGHPHVTQGAEYYRGKLIVYSLGNFIFDGFDPPEPEETRTGWALRLNLDKSGLLSWDTRTARIDAQGTPHPLPGAKSPCGQRGDPEIRACVNP